MPLSNLSDEGSKVDKKKIANDEPSSESTDKKQSQFIKVEAIRETLDSLGKGAYRSNKKIVLIYPLESLQAVSSNALLKSLEEPADTTLFILITSRIDKILPTIKSRCRQIAMPRPTESVAIDWLVSQLAVANIKLSREELLKDLYESGRSPLTAWVHISQQEDKYQSESKITLIDALSKGDEINWLDTADKVFKLPMPEILLIIERWVSDLLIVKLTNKNFYYPNYHTSMQGCLNGVNIHKLTNYWKKLIECKRHELHPLSSKLQIEALLLDYRNIFKS
jgi:DNA polymerase-3 subunit delta'